MWKMRPWKSLKIFSIQGSFIGSSSEVHDLCPGEAAKMYQTVHEDRTYPIDIDRIRARRVALRQENELDLRFKLPV